MPPPPDIVAGRPLSRPRRRTVAGQGSRSTNGLLATDRLGSSIGIEARVKRGSGESVDRVAQSPSNKRDCRFDKVVVCRIRLERTQLADTAKENLDDPCCLKW
jgi:hypothetical protein